MRARVRLGMGLAPGGGGGRMIRSGRDHAYCTRGIRLRDPFNTPPGLAHRWPTTPTPRREGSRPSSSERRSHSRPHPGCARRKWDGPASMPRPARTRAGRRASSSAERCSVGTTCTNAGCMRRASVRRACIVRAACVQRACNTYAARAATRVQHTCDSACCWASLTVQAAVAAPCGHPAPRRTGGGCCR